MAELIVSLDVHSKEKARKLIEILGSSVEYYKIGPVPLFAYGTDIIEFLIEKGKKVFLDMKFFDIPNTVENAVYNSCKLRVSSISVHTMGGIKMLKSAISGRNKARAETKIIGVTILTSFTQEDLEIVGIKQDIDFHIEHLAKLAFETGLDGIVCSARELKFLRKKFPDGFLMFCPGIRPGGSTKDDQKRVADVSQAVRDGADYIIVGRPVIENDNPLTVVQQIKKEIMENEKSGKSS